MKRTHKPQRNACEGPWIATGDAEAFKAFLAQEGYAVREHPDLWREGFQVRHAGHWMSLLYNKNTRRYTADRRLSLIVQSFATAKPKKVEAKLPKGPMVKCVHCGTLFEQYFEKEDMCVDCDD